MLIVNSSAPKPGQTSFQRFRFSNTTQRISQKILYQLIYPAQLLFVMLLPIQVIFPCVKIPFNCLHPDRLILNQLMFRKLKSPRFILSYLPF